MFLLLITLYVLCEKSVYGNCAVIIWNNEYVLIHKNNNHDRFYAVSDISEIKLQKLKFHFYSGSDHYITRLGGPGIIDFFDFMEDKNEKAVASVTQNAYVLADVYYMQRNDIV